VTPTGTAAVFEVAVDDRQGTVGDRSHGVGATRASPAFPCRGEARLAQPRREARECGWFSGPDGLDGSRTRDPYTGQRWAMGWGWPVGWQLWVTDRTVSGRHVRRPSALQARDQQAVSAAM